MELFELSPLKGCKRGRKRVGRGNAAGSGRTCGKGEKGQNARAGGGVRLGFEGGQTPLYRRIPKIGFRSRKQYLGLNLFNTVSLSDLERFEDGSVVDAAALRAAGVIKRRTRRAGVKVLGSGSISKKLTVKVNAITKSAKEKIEAAGGTVELS